MKKLTTPVIIIAVLIAVCVGAYCVYDYIEKHRPSPERIELADYFGNPSSDEVLLYRYHKRLDFDGKYKNDRVYIPFDWVYDNINDIFYLDEIYGKLLYSTADEVITLPMNSIEYFDNIPYIALDEVAERSDLITRELTGGEVNRVFLTDETESYVTATLLIDGVIRTEESIKAPGVADLLKDAVVDIINDPYAELDEIPEDAWVEVMAEDGCRGFIERKYLGNFTDACIISTYTAPEYSHILSDSPVLLAWHQVTNEASNNYIKDLMKTTSGINVLSPTWYSVTDDKGNINSFANHNYVNYAHENGIKVWALIDNFSPDINSTKLLANTESRTNLITNLITSAKEYEIDGINIDFELLPEEASRHFAQFIRELSIACRHNNLVLSVDNPATASFNLHYRRDVQAQVADYVINMGYDEHYAGGEAGSVSSLPFVEESLDLALTQVPANQLINAIPFYTRIWVVRGDETSSAAEGLGESAKWVEDNNITLTWNDTLGQYYGDLFTDTEAKYIWLENNDSLKLKIEAAKKRNLAGIACWKLGLENSAAWEVVKY